MEIALIRSVECETRDEVKMVEYDLMKEDLNCVNLNRGVTLYDRRKYHRDYNNNYGRYVCECGSDLRKDSKSQHKHSKKHTKYLQSIYDGCIQNQSVFIWTSEASRCGDCAIGDGWEEDRCV